MTAMIQNMMSASLVPDRPLRRWHFANGHRECDDGNEINTDACGDNCIRARCGDGVLPRAKNVMMAIGSKRMRVSVAVKRLAAEMASSAAI